MSAPVETDPEDVLAWDFSAVINISCGCGGYVQIGPRSIAGQCWRCQRVYRTQVQVFAPSVG